MGPAEGFEAFVAAYESGSISAGARLLGIPRATLSRQLSRLEERLGTRLVHRDTRSFHPTTAGDELYEPARRIVEESRAIVANLRRRDGKPRGRLRVSMPPHQGDEPLRLDEMLCAFLQRYPDVTLEVHASLEHIDLSAARIDVALRAGVARPSNLIGRVVYETAVGVVGAPTYLAAHPAPTRAEDLVEHRLLLGFDAGQSPTQAWPLLEGGEVKVATLGVLVSSDILLLRTAARQGMGLALLPELVVAGDIASGRLVRVLDDQVGMRNTLSVVYPAKPYLLPKVRSFIDHVVEWLQGPDIGSPIL